MAASIVSTPVSENTYRGGENIDIAVDFSYPVVLEGAPTLALGVGQGVRHFSEQIASYHSGSGTTRLIFRFNVPSGLFDLDGLQLYRNPVRIEGSNRIWSTEVPRRAAEITLVDFQRLLPVQYIDARNLPPEFGVDDPAFTVLRLPENEGAGRETTARNIEYPVIANDPNGDDTLTYSIEGADSAFFEIEADTAQLTTKVGERYDHETKASYSFRVKADDGYGGTDTMAVRVSITDVDEPPLTPNAPSVSRRFDSTPSLDVSWAAPANEGRPVIAHYDLQYRAGSSGEWIDGPQDVSGRRATIDRLEFDTDHQVHVRAVNHEGDGAWSEPGAGRTWPAQRLSTGAPEISGKWQAGRRLTASKGDIADDNGVPPESEFTWQWLRVDGSNETEISGANGRTYTLRAADIGKRVKVRASFTDGLGSEESRLSLAYPAYGGILSSACPLPSLGSRREVWSGRITAGAIESDLMNGRFEHGYAEERAGRLSDRDFELGTARREVELLSTQLVAGGVPPIDLRIQLDRNLTSAQKAALVLDICDDETMALSTSSIANSLSSFRFRGFGSLWFDGLSRNVRLSLPANTEATGAPAIAGTPPAVGQTLTVSKGDISDMEGVPGEGAFKWQWLRVDGATESEITGATDRTYTPTASDVGKRFRVRAAFIDGLGSEEIRTSVVTEPVITALPLITIAPGASPVIEGTDATFTLSRSGSTTTALAVEVGVFEAGGDMVASSAEGARTVSFEAAQSTATLSVPTMDDEADETDSVVTATILADTDDPAIYWLGAPDSATVIVNDNEDDSTNELTLHRLGITPSRSLLRRSILDHTEQVEGLICFGVWFNGADPAGFTESDLDLQNATLADFRYPGSAAQLQRITVNITGNVGEVFVFRIPRGALDAGNEEAVFRAIITGNPAPTSADTAVTIDEDTEHIFAASDFVFLDAGRDVLASVRITALPARGALTLDGAALHVNARVTRARIDDGDLVYTPPADANGADYASFTFRVSDGRKESASSYSMTVDVDAVNDAATGLPTISGTARVGQTLTADASAIRDNADGLPPVSTFTYQWLRVSGGNETPIQGASARTYRLAAADAGAQFKVRVSFTDLDNHDEALTSEAFPTSTPVAEMCAAPDLGDQREVWTGLVSVGSSSGRFHGYRASLEGSLDNTNMEFGAYRFTVDGAFHLDQGQGRDAGELYFSTAEWFSNPPRLKMTLYVCDEPFPFSAVTGITHRGYNHFKWRHANQDWSGFSTQRLTLSIPPNNPATGQPAISGTAQVGQTLSAEVSAIGDVDGLPNASAFSYQWVRVDGETESDIDGATESSYPPVTDDVGKQVRVRVSFMDNLGGAEALTSEAYPATPVAANTAPTGAPKTIELAEDGSHTFSAADFGFQDADPGDALASVRIAARPAAGTLALGGTPVTDNQAIAAAQLGQLVFTPPPDANGAGYASFTFRVSDGTDESALAYTITLDVTAVNDPATGLPTISGTARVGQTLTADVSAIRDDADGLPQASNFLYQWLRVSGANETPILNADARTYRLEAADAGAKFKVRVSFTDLDGHDEARTSDAWPAQQTVLVNTAPTGASKTIGLAEDGFHPFSEADFGYRDGDGDALASVRIAARPAAGTLALGGTPVTDNQEIAAAQLGQLVFTPPPDANGAGYASFTFKVGDGTDESALSYTITLDVTAVNDPATGLPTISGTARVGQTLTADVSAIRDDADGLPQASNFLYQWLRVSGANETPIQNADARTYRLEAADAGAKFKVRVSFTDLDGHPEARTSDAWPTQQTVLVNTAPTGVGKTVTLDEDDSNPFSEADFGYRDGDGDALASVRITVLPAAGSLTLDGNGVQANGTVTKTQLDAGDLVYTPPPDANGAGYASFTFKVGDGTDESALAYTITLDVTAVNDPATGLPTISGTARVGQTLTADVSAIRDDADGLPAPASFLYQWLRVSGANETPILNADARTYRLASADAGAKFKVRVSFTDLDGHDEARTSDAWPATTVAANAAPTAAAKTVTLDEDTTHTFSAADFGFQDADPGDALASLRIAARPAAGTLALGGTPVTANQEIAAAQLGQLVFAPPPDANGAGYASFTFRVSDGTDESALAYTITLDVTAVNDPATGASDDLGDGPRRPDADRRRERDQGRCRRPAAGLQLPLPVAARLGRQRDADPERRRQDLPPGVGRRRCQVQGARQLHRPRRPPRGPHQRRLADAADGFGEHRADGGVEDDRPGRGRLPPLLRGRLRVPGRRRRCACQRHDRHASGPGQGRARPRRHSRDRQPGDRRRAAGPARVRPAARRQRRRLRQLHVQGQRRHRRERLGLHHHPRRRRGERPRDRASDDLRDGARRPDADRRRERDQGRCRRPAAGLQLPLPVAARRGRQRDADPERQTPGPTAWRRPTPGAKFKVRVSFTDLDGHPEARTSDAWPTQQTVLVNTAPTGASKTIGLAEDGFHPFSEADFGYRDGDGDALASVTIATLPAQGKGALALGGTPVTANQEIAAAQLGQLVFAPPPDANGAGYASFTFRVSDGTDESALAYTITLDVTAVNDPATGAPTISGTERVGHVLTADVSAIEDDADGLPQASSFLYQWLRVSGANETPIQGASASTYRLEAADAGAKFKVRVSFTDLDGHPEARTSDAWPATTVAANAAPTAAAKTVTLDEDTTHTFSAADFGFQDADPGDALASVRIAARPAAGTLALGGTPVTDNQEIAAAQLGQLVFTPPPDANGAGYASFTFKVGDGTDESALSYTITLDVTAVNDPATGLPTISGRPASARR